MPEGNNRLSFRHCLLCKIESCFNILDVAIFITVFSFIAELHIYNLVCYNVFALIVICDLVSLKGGRGVTSEDAARKEEETEEEGTGRRGGGMHFLVHFEESLLHRDLYPVCCPLLLPGCHSDILTAQLFIECNLF
jgi:hypothetical protein